MRQPCDTGANSMFQRLDYTVQQLDCIVHVCGPYGSRAGL